MTSNNYFVKWRSNVSGPFAINELERMIRNNEISRIALVSDDGKTWTALAKMETYKRITEESAGKFAEPKPQEAKLPAVEAADAAEAAAAEEEEEDRPVMAWRDPHPAQTFTHGPSFEDLRREQYQAGRMGRRHIQPQYNYLPEGARNHYGNQSDTGLSSKSRVSYQCLGFFLGGLGIHNFYAGRTGCAVAQLLLTLFGFGVGNVIVSIWVLCNIFSVDRDGDNRIMQGESIAGVLLLITIILIGLVTWLLVSSGAMSGAFNS